jgi:hypothetical protein
MTKSKKRGKKKESPSQHQKNTSHAQDQREEPSLQLGWIPLWGWILIFLVPLIASEFMFYTADRKVSMILFPIAWIGFWVAMMQRSGWAILKRGKSKEE